MKSKSSLVFSIILIAVMVTILALLINHLVCQDGDAPELLIGIDNAVTQIIIKTFESIKDGFDYLKYLYEKVTAIPTLEYPADYLPVYPDSRVTQYHFDQETNTLNMISGTNDLFESIVEFYNTLFSEEIKADYFKQYIFENEYTAYGMIGNLTFLLEINSNSTDKYQLSISTQLHYLTGDELSMENFFRSQKGPNSNLYTYPYISIYQTPGDEGYVYLQLKDYKSRLLNIDTHVELYFDGEFYSSRYYGDTIRVPIGVVNKVQNIKMIAFDENNCIRAIDIMENTLCYDAQGQGNLYDLVENYSSAKNLFIINSHAITDISFFEYMSDMETLCFAGSENIRNYAPLLKLKNLKRLYLNNVNGSIIKNLNQLTNLSVLELSNVETPINLGEDFTEFSLSELSLENCTNITFDEYGLFSLDLEKLKISNNHTLKDIPFISVYPNLRIIELSDCDNLVTLLNTSNLTNLSMLSVDNCRNFDLSQPLDNMPSLMNVQMKNLLNFGKVDDKYIQSIWANNNIVAFNVENCSHVQKIDYYNQPWKGVN